MSDQARVANRLEIGNGDSLSALEAAVLDEEVIAESTPNEKAKLAETLKNVADARSSNELVRIKRSQLRTTAFAAWIAIIGVVALAFVSISEQRKQSERLAVLQREANEDAQWREALKSVSFRDPASSQMGVLAMQGFFGSPQYSSQARSIAALLLPNVSNVYAFDEVLSTMGPPHTDRGNYHHLTGIAQMLGFDQRAKFHISGAASKKNTPFLMESLGAIKANPKDLDRDKDQQTRVAAWELDTVSHTLRSVWTDKDPQKRLSPSGWQLSGAVLENASFDGLDFTETDFSFGILFNSSFKRTHFDGATLKDTYLRKVALDDADFSGVKVYSGSKWEDSNWWDAKCIPQPLLDYLLEADSHPVTEETKSKLVATCH
jgi:Pentapeptide repeats (8 copies)